MTQLETILERAADAGPIGFDTDDVRHRVRRRRRTRRTIAAATAVLVLIGAVAAALDRPEEGLDVRGNRATVGSVVGRWVPVGVDGVVAESSGAWYLDVRTDGTVGGVDECGEFAGRWTFDGARLVVTPVKGSDTHCPGGTLRSLLAAGTSVAPGPSPGTLELRGGTIRVVLAVSEMIETEVMAPLQQGGVVKATFRTPRVLQPGAHRMFAAWTLLSSANYEVHITAQAGFVAAGLPRGCELNDPARWDTGRGDFAPHSRQPTRLAPDRRSVAGGIWIDVPERCAGQHELVLQISGSNVVGVHDEVRVTIGRG